MNFPFTELKQSIMDIKHGLSPIKRRLSYVTFILYNYYRDHSYCYLCLFCARSHCWWQWLPKKISMLTGEKLPRVQKLRGSLLRVCVAICIRANSGGSFESLNVAAICRRMLITSWPGPPPFILRPKLAIARSGIFVRVLLPSLDPRPDLSREGQAFVCFCYPKITNTRWICKST